MENLFLKAPDAKALSVTYNGMTFDEFRQLDDAAIEELRVQAGHEWSVACVEFEFLSEQWFEALDKTEDFHNFCEWRKYGVPDRDMSEDEFVERMYEHADMRRAEDPSYGVLTAEDYAGLSDAEHELAWWVLDEVWRDGISCAGQPVIDPGGMSATVAKRLNVSYENLVAHGILNTYTIPRTIMLNDSTGYVLTEKFAAHLFSLRYPSEGMVKPTDPAH